MFEGILQRILLALFGKFIDGIDKKHITLGVLSGNLIIEQVSIKKEALDQLELPIELIYSSIQRLQIIMPWNKLSTQRVEIRIKNVFLLVTTKDKKDWNLNEINSFSKKVESVELFIKKHFEEQLRNKNILKEQQAQQNKQEKDMKDSPEKVGYISKMITKIIDNLYISIQNVHCRYEHNISRHTFSWGITIHKIEQQTLDESWKQSSIHDRNDIQNKGHYINKQIQLEKLAMYWNSDDHLLFGQLSQNVIQQKMQQELVFEPELTNQLNTAPNQRFRSGQSAKYIFCLNASAKVVQTYLHFHKTPEYKVNIELMAMDYKIKHTQVQEIIKLLQLFNNYQVSLKFQRDLYKVITIRPDKNNYTNKPQRQYLSNFFSYLVNKVLQENMRKKYIECYLKGLCKKTKPQRILKGKELNSYLWIVLKAQIESLQQWSLTAIEINNNTSNLLSSSNNWWPFKKTTKEQLKIQKADEEKLRQIIDSALFKQRNDLQVDLDAYIYLEFNLTINDGSLKLMRKQKRLEEGFNIIWHNFNLQLKKRNNNFELELFLQDMEVQMFSVEEKNDIIVPILKKIKTYEYLDKPLMQLKLEKHPLYKPHIFSSTVMEMQKIEVTLFIASMNRILAYFRIPPTENAPPQRIQIKESAKNGIDNLLQHSQKNELKVTILSPVVIVPTKQINDLNSDCWILKLGDLDLSSIDNDDNNKKSPHKHYHYHHNIKNNYGVSPNKKQFANFTQASDQPKTNNTNFYDTYVLDLKSVQLEHYSSIHYFYNYQKFSTNEEGRKILNHPLRLKSTKLDIIEPFSITININVIKQLAAELSGKPQTKIAFQLPHLKITLTPLVPYTLNILSETITNLSQDQTLSSILQQEKTKLIKYSTCKGYLRKRGTFFRSWTNYYVVMSGWYLYFYQNENDNDFDNYLSLREVAASEAQVDIGVPYSFKLKTTKEVIYFQCKDQQDLKKWLKCIFQRNNDIKHNKLNTPNYTNKLQQSDNKVKLSQAEVRPSYIVADQSTITTKYKFCIESLEILLKFDETNQLSQSCIQIDKIKLKSLSKISQSFQQFSISSISITDNGKYVLNSISFSQPVTPSMKDINENQLKTDKIYKKYEKLLLTIKNKVFRSHGAIKFRIFQHDQVSEIKENAMDLLLLFSDLQVIYKQSFVLKLAKFAAKPVETSNTVKQKETSETTQASQTQDLASASQERMRKVSNIGTLQQGVQYTNLPQQTNKMTQDELNYKSGRTIKSIKSFTQQKSQQSEVDSEDKLPVETYTRFYIYSQDIKIYLKSLKDTDIILINVSRLQGSIKLNEHEKTISGKIHKISLIDLISLKLPHTFLGFQATQKQAKKQNNFGLTIFSMKQPKQEEYDEELNMVEFKYVSYANTSTKLQDWVYNDLSLIINDCFIDYLHSTIQHVSEYAGEHQKQGDISKQSVNKNKTETFEVERDLDQIAATIYQPKLFKLQFQLVNPIVYLKPLDQSEYSIELRIQGVLLRIESNLEKNRVAKTIPKAGKKQSQVVTQLESIWCQNIQMHADNMQIKIKSDNSSDDISNSFSIVLRLQTPLFINEYELLFPNITIDKNKEMRMIVSQIDIHLIKQRYYFLVEILKSQLLTKPKKQQSTNVSQERVEQKISQPKEFNGETIWLCSFSDLSFKILDQNHELTSKEEGSIGLPIIDFKMKDSLVSLNIKTDLTKHFIFAVHQFSSHFYQYKQVHGNTQVQGQGIINSLISESKPLQQFLKDYHYSDVQANIEELNNRLKSEFYNNVEISKESQQLHIQGRIDTDNNQSISIQMAESKILLNLFYFSTIISFFTIEKSSKRRQSQPVEHVSQLEQTDNQIKKQGGLLSSLKFDLKRSLILVQGKSSQQLLTIQQELNVNLAQIYDDSYHQLYHQINNIELGTQNNEGNNITTKITVAIKDFQVFSAPLDKLNYINLRDKKTLIVLKKRILLRPTAIEFVSHTFICNCDPTMVSQITENTITVDKIRVHLSYNDLILILDTLQFQNEQQQSSKSVFSQSYENCEEEDDNVQVKQLISQSSDFKFMDSSSKTLKKTFTNAQLLSRIKLLKKQSTQNIYDESDQIFNDDGIDERDSESEQSEVQLIQSESQQDSSKPRYFLTKMQPIIDTLEIVIINDLSLSYVPLVLLNFNIKQLVQEDNKYTSLINGCFILGLHYFNPIASKMEPILESTELDLLVIMNRFAYPKLNVLIEKKQVKVQDTKQLENAQININVSTQMAITLSKTLKLWSRKFNESRANHGKGNHHHHHQHKIVRLDTHKLSKIVQSAFSVFGSVSRAANALQNKQQTMNQDQVTLFTVINHSGYQIKVHKQQGQDIPVAVEAHLNSIVIQNNECKNYVIESNEEDYAKTFDQEHKLFIKFQDQDLTKYTLETVSVNSVTTQKLNWIKHQQKLSYYFIISTEIQTLNKIVNLLSPHMLINRTDCQLIARIFQEDQSQKVIVLDQNDQEAIPQHLFNRNSFITIQFQDKKYGRHSPQCQPILLFNLFQKSLTEINHGSFYTLAYRNTSMVQGVTFIEFKPLFIIHNCLPIPIQINFHSNVNLQLQSLLNSYFTEQSSQLINKIPRVDSIAVNQQQFQLQSFPSQNDYQMQRSFSISESGVAIQECIRVENNMIELVPQADFQLHSVSLREQLSAQININGYQMSDIVILANAQGELAQQDNLTIKDVDNSNQTLNVGIERDFSKYSREIYFYILNCIINTTPFRLWYYSYNENESIKLPGQHKSYQRRYHLFEHQYDKIIVSNKVKYLRLSLENDQLNISNEVNVQMLGSFSVQLKAKSNNQYKLYEFGVYISVASLAFKGVYTKVIEIMPKYVLINNSQQKLTYCQSGCEIHAIIIEPQARVPIVWPDCRQEKSIKIQNTDTKMVWSWSGDIFIQELRSTQFYSAPIGDLSCHSFPQQNSEKQLNHSTVETSGIYKQFHIKKYDPEMLQQYKQQQFTKQQSSLQRSTLEFQKESLFLNAEVIQIKSTNFILIQKPEEQDYAYKLTNKCQHFKLLYSQDSFLSKQEWLLPKGKQTPFAWEFPSHSYKLKVKFLYEILNEVQHTEIIDFQQHINSKEFHINCFDGKQFKIQITTEFQGITRVVTFEDFNPLDPKQFLTASQINVGNDQTSDQNIDKFINLFIDSLGISVIMRKQGRIIEGNYIYFKHIEMALQECFNHTTIQLRVKFFNIDNNSSFDTTTPTIMTVSRCQQALNDPNYYFVDASLQRDHKIAAIALFNFIRISIKPMTIQIDEQYINVVLESWKYVMSCIESDQDEAVEFQLQIHSIKSLIFQRPAQREYNLHIMNEHKTESPFLMWNSVEINSSRKLLYIKEILLPPIELVFSFHKRFQSVSEDPDGENIFNYFSTAIGATVQNINEAQIKLLGLRMETLYDSSDIIGAAIKNHYKTEAIKSLLKIIGSIEIIGNPFGLIQQISVGIVDFIEMPIEGLRHGPLELGIGIARGTGSLIKNTVAGAFYSMNKFTGSISSSVSLLSMDDEYLEKRRIFMLKKPNHIIDGLAQAGQSLYTGFSEGVTGVVMQPYRETQRDGFRGLIKGTFKGISGLVVKPVSGVLDATAKAAESVANTATHFDDRANDQRIRFVRQFYEKSRYFTRYCYEDARILDLLQKFSNGSLSKIDFKEYYEQEEQQVDALQKRILKATNQMHQSFEKCCRILVLSYQVIAVLDGISNLIIQEFKLKDIETVTLVGDDIMIHSKTLGMSRLQINLRDKQQVINSIMYLREQVLLIIDY